MKPRILVAIVTCHKFRNRADTQRRLWVGDVSGADVRFFLGGGEPERPDEIILPARDDYRSLPEKCKQVFQWALDNGYDWCVKLDDDVYLRPERLMNAIPETGDYVGRCRGPDPMTGLPAPYCSGFCYWMNRRAMEARVNGVPVNNHNEDVVTGNMLSRAGISGILDNRYVVARSKRNMLSGKEGPRRGNDTIASCEYDPDEMEAAHQEYLSIPSKSGFVKLPANTPFDRVDVLIKTFLRDGLLEKCVNGVEKSLPGARMIIVDDGWESRPKVLLYSGASERGHVIQWMPFDSGYGAKSNAGAKHYNRDYVLRIADDFDMGAPGIREGIEKMIDVLDSDPAIGIVSGRHNGEPYEANITETVRPDGLKDMVATRVPDDTPVQKTPNGTEYICCDYTVNFSLVRRELMQSMVWDERYKVGGDHLDLYMHCWKAGLGVAYAVGVNVNAIPAFTGCQAKEYSVYRRRAQFSLPWTFERHGWNSWTGIDGDIDTRESVQRWADTHPVLPPNNIHKPAKKHYGIQPSYKEREHVPHFDDTIPGDGEYQVEVYDLAKKVFSENGLRTVVDIGCGSAEKLVARFRRDTIRGVEVEPTLGWLRKKYPDHKWYSHDEITGPCDLVICSDVIEHVDDPDIILDAIHRLQPKMVVISTPDRSVMPWPPTGPPRNIHHVREWTSKEFAFYLGRRSTILQHYISNAEQFTQVVVTDGMGPRVSEPRTIEERQEKRENTARWINEQVALKRAARGKP